MTKDVLTSTYNRLKRDMAENRLSSALAELDIMAQTASAPWNIKSEISHLSENYRFLCKFALEGADDPTRAIQYNRIKSSLSRIALSILRESDIKESNRLYFGILRFERMQKDSNITSLLDDYRKVNDRYSLMQFEGNTNSNSSEASKYKKMLETHAERIFNLIWVTHPLTKEDGIAIENSLKDETLPLSFKRLIVSALLLGSIDYYDECKLEIFARSYLNGDKDLQIYLAVALLLALWCNRSIDIGEKLSAILETLSENSQWNSDVRSIFRLFALKRDSERIERMVNDEIIPDMIKLKPDLEKRLGKQSLEELSDDFNPEWEEMLGKSGIADKLKEINSLQEEGCDVMMATFSRLKSFPFFNDVSHWFVPFDRYHSSVTNILGDADSELSLLIERSMPMCDSDKYSMVMALEAMPRQNRRNMVQQFEALGNQNNEMFSSLLNPQIATREKTADYYIQDIFRFFKLFRRKSEFKNPFSSPVNLTILKSLKSSFVEIEDILPIAEFYFKHKYYPEALELFGYMETLGNLDFALLQKEGFCFEKEGKIEKALSCYRKSELLKPESQWTLRHIASCLRSRGDLDEAISYYRKVEATSKDDVSLAVVIGNCALECGKIDEAIKSYYKADFLGDRTGNALRGLAWSYFLNREYEKSLKYFERVISSGEAKTNDYLNCGHLMMALRRFRDAADRYIMSIHADGMRLDNFEESIQTDRHYLVDAGVDSLMIDIIVDTVLSEANTD